jgi:hypothetical protein
VLLKEAYLLAILASFFTFSTAIILKMNLKLGFLTAFFHLKMMEIYHTFWGLILTPPTAVSF